MQCFKLQQILNIDTGNCLQHNNKPERFRIKLQCLLSRRPEKIQFL